MLKKHYHQKLILLSLLLIIVGIDLLIDSKFLIYGVLSLYVLYLKKQSGSLSKNSTDIAINLIISIYYVHKAMAASNLVTLDIAFFIILGFSEILRWFYTTRKRLMGFDYLVIFLTVLQLYIFIKLITTYTEIYWFSPIILELFILILPSA